MGLELSRNKDSKPVSTPKGLLVWKLVLNEAENERCVKVELDFTTQTNSGHDGFRSQAIVVRKQVEAAARQYEFLRVKPWSLTLVRLQDSTSKSTVKKG